MLRVVLLAEAMDVAQHRRLGAVEMEDRMGEVLRGTAQRLRQALRRFAGRRAVDAHPECLPHRVAAALLTPTPNACHTVCTCSSRVNSSQAMRTWSAST